MIPIPTNQALIPILTPESDPESFTTIDVTRDKIGEDNSKLAFQNCRKF